MTASNKHHLPAIEGGVPVRQETLPFYRPSIDESDVELVSSTLRSGWLTLGPVTSELEKELARYLGADHVIVGSGLAPMLFKVSDKAEGVGIFSVCVAEY